MGRAGDVQNDQKRRLMISYVPSNPDTFFRFYNGQYWKKKGFHSVKKKIFDLPIIMPDAVTALVFAFHLICEANI